MTELQMPPELGTGVMLHPVLKGLDATVLLVVQSALNRIIEAACCKIGLDANVDELWAVLL
jgi:hypothetical protein